MKLDIEKIFSEFVTGIVFMILCLTLFFLSGHVQVSESLGVLKEWSSFSNLLFFLIIAGFIGFVIDGVGLGFGEVLFDDLVYRYKISAEKRKSFFENASESTLAYRNRQWAYYSCYRNLFLLLIPYSVAIALIVSGDFMKMLLLGVLFVEFFLFQCLKLLLKLYYSFEDNC